MKKLNVGLVLMALVCAAAVLTGCATAQSYYEEGLNMENSDYAIYKFSEAIKKNPNFAEAYFERGKAYLNRNNSRLSRDETIINAMRDFSKAIEIKPDFAEAYYERGKAYLNNSDNFNRKSYLYFDNMKFYAESEAMEDVSKAIDIKPDFIDAYRFRGLVCFYKGQYSDAIADYSKAIAIKPDFAKVYILRGEAYMVVKKYSESVADYAEAVRLVPDNADYQKSLADTKVMADPNYVTSADDFTVSQNAQGGITITGYTGKYRRVVIPPTISGIKVTEIGSHAFGVGYVNGKYVGRDSVNGSLVGVVIPNTVTKIGSEVFNATVNSSYYYFREGRHLIAKREDGRKNSLGALTIPDSVTDIGELAFAGCGISTLSLGKGVVTIGTGAFANNQIPEITFPPSLKTIESVAFIDNQLSTVTLPNGITNIGWYCFTNNPLTAVVIPPSLADDYSHFERAFKMDPWAEAYGIQKKYPGINITSITLPDNIKRDLPSNFGETLNNFYISQGRKAGVYTLNGQIWTYSAR